MVKQLSGAKVMMLGTMASRLLGFGRTMMFLALLGTTLAASSFKVANTLPNNVLLLIAGGFLNAIIVPYVTDAMKRDDGTERVNAVLTWSLTAMAAITVTLTALAPFVTRIYANSDFSDEAIKLSVLFAYLCLPQIFFYGVYILAGQVLNARDKFAAFAWAPAVANVVNLAGWTVFWVKFGRGDGTVIFEPATWTTEMMLWLAGSATAGIVAQGATVWLGLVRSGHKYRPSFRRTNLGLKGASGVAMWTFAGVLAAQAVYAATSQVLTKAAGQAAAAEAAGAGGDLVKATPSLASWEPAFLLFMLPHSVTVVSIVTASFTRLARKAADDDMPGCQDELVAALRHVGIFSIAAAVGLVTLAGPLGGLMTSQPASADAISKLLLILGIGAVPFSCNYALQRLFYALTDGKTPFAAQVAGLVCQVVAAAIAFWVLPFGQMGQAIAAGTALSALVGCVWLWIAARRRLGSASRSWTIRVWTYWLKLLPLAAIMAGLILLLDALWKSFIADVLPGAIPSQLISALHVACAGLPPAGLYLLLARKVRS